MTDPGAGLQRALAALIVAGILGLGAPTSVADYLQSGVDAARSGVSSTLGPERDDVAFEVALPGVLPANAGPLLLKEAVYATTTELVLPWDQAPPPGLDADSIVRVDLATATVDILVQMEARPLGIGSDGEMLYIPREGGMDAYTLDGQLVWAWEHPDFTLAPHQYTTCIHPAIDGGSVYLLCNSVSLREPWPWQLPPGTLWWATPGVATDVVPFVAAVDAATGTARWIWADTAMGMPGGSDVGTPHAAAVDAGERNLGGISVLGEHVVIITQNPQGDFTGDVNVRAFRSDDGDLRWTRSVSFAEMAGEGVTGQDIGFLDNFRVSTLLGPATGTRDTVYYVVDDLIAVDIATNNEIWRQPLPQVDTDIIGGPALVLSGDDLFVASRGMLYKFDLGDGSRVWDRVIGAGEHFDQEPMVLAGGTLFARTHGHGELVSDSTVSPDFFYAFDPQDGNVDWKHRMDMHEGREWDVLYTQFAMAVGSGVMAIQGADGALRVLGTTAASIGPTVQVSTLYPAVGEEVRVDLAGTRPGVQGPPTHYRAAWGDGRVTEWQESPAFVHTYAVSGDYLATFQARNAAGQTGSIEHMFHVGGSPPPELNLIQWAFAPERQNFVFGILGILLAVGGAVFGVTIQHRKRRRLQQELDAVDAIYSEAADDPAICARALKERNVLARGLVAEGKLDEAQFQVLKERIDGLMRSLRVPMVEEEWDFLPHGMVQSLRMMMEDGSVTRYERDAFLEKLAKIRGVTSAQKQRVQQRLEAWFEEDAGKT